MNSFKILFTVLTLVSSASASDHIDGVPSLELHEQVDLTDLYVFPTPEKADHLTVILNLYPGVSDSGHFSKSVQYNLIFRQARPGLSSEKSLIKTSAETEKVLNCRFTDPAHHHHFAKDERQFVSCSLKQGDELIREIETVVNAVDSLKDGSIKIYTGPRSDSFFISSEHFGSVTERKGFTATPGTGGDNIMERINVLSIALELDLKQLFPENQGRWMAIAAESLAHADGHLKVLDRVGRPEITNLSLHSFDDAEKIKAFYNQQPPFYEIPQDLYEKFQERLVTNIGTYDTYDEVNDWADDELKQLTGVLLSDYLVIDLSKNCSPAKNSFFSIEKSLMRGSDHNSCGGRQLTDDIMSTLFALYIGGLDGNLGDFSSGVMKPYQSSSKELGTAFPYLVSPEPTGFGHVNLKRALLNYYLKRNQD